MNTRAAHTRGEVMQPETTNPYASPTTDADFRADGLPDGVLSPAQRRSLQVGEVVVAWEKLRLWYNLALTLVSIPLVAIDLMRLTPRLADLFTLGAAVIAANACFLAGPVVEAYWTWWLGPTPWLRNCLFFPGTAFAALVTVGVWLAMP